MYNYKYYLSYDWEMTDYKVSVLYGFMQTSEKAL